MYYCPKEVLCIFKTLSVAKAMLIRKGQNKSVAHYTSQKAKYGGLFLSTKIKDLSYIFSPVAKSDCVAISLAFSEYNKSARIYLVAESLVGTRLTVFLFFILRLGFRYKVMRWLRLRHRRQRLLPLDERI